MASSNATFYSSGIAGVLFGPVRGGFYVSMLLVALIVAAWIVDWIFVFKVWPDGIDRLQTILADDLVRIGQVGASHYDITSFALRTANVLYEGIFGITGVYDMASRFAAGAALSIPDTIVRNAYLENYQAIRVAMVGTQLFGVRIAGLITCLPLFVLAYIVATADGLVQRSIRRASGGNESANIYHRAKYFQLAIMVSASALYLLLPTSIDFRALLLPGIAASALLARCQWTYYKKHL